MICTYLDFDISIVKEAKTQEKYGKKTKKRYKNLVCAFDIETSRISEIDQTVMYIWQFQIDSYCTVIGRTWVEFKAFLQRLSTVLNENEWLVVYDHNLSYEFQFLSGIYDFSQDEVFALDKRKVAKCDMMEHFEFRCSYIHSNMSLAAFTEKMGATHSKLVGALDYEKERWYYTELSDEEMAYCTYDVIGLVEALKIEMTNDGDDLYTIPLTSTGYVRRDIRAAMQDQRWVRSLFPRLEEYELEREAFRGGNTHANRYYAGWLLENVHSADRSSSYPGVQMNHKYPVTTFRKIAKPTPDAGKLIEMVKRRDKAILARIAFEGVELADESWGCPYIPRDKVRGIENGVYDNGRVLSADKFEMTVTDIDLIIICQEYQITKMTPSLVYTSKYGGLPQPMRDCVEEYYRKKTELKDVEGQEYQYFKSKNKLNSIYGMTAQDPVKESILYLKNEFTVDESKGKEELLEEYKKMAFIPYSWGVWCTAWARWELERGLREVDKQGGEFVYCDTDSIKYMGDVSFDEYNSFKEQASRQSGAFATDPKGNTHYMEVFEQESDSDLFVTLGAKKYASMADGKLKITVAGVPKKAGAKELEAKGGIAEFKPGFIFANCGKLETVYNDDVDMDYVNSDGIKIHITKNVTLRPTTYCLGITDEYEQLLESAQLYERARKTLKGTKLLVDK